MGYSISAAFSQFFTTGSPHPRSLRLPTLLCVAALAACLCASPSFAQTGPTVWVSGRAWDLVETDLKFHCKKYENGRFPDDEQGIQFVTPPIWAIPISAADYKKAKDEWSKLKYCWIDPKTGQSIPTPPDLTPPTFPHFSTPELPARFCSAKEKRDFVDMLFTEAQAMLDAAIAYIHYEGQIAQLVQSGTVPSDLVHSYQVEEKLALFDADRLRERSNELHNLALRAQGIPVEDCREKAGLEEEPLEGALAPGRATDSATATAPPTTDDKTLATLPATTDDKSVTTSPAPTTTASDATDKTGLLESAKKDVLGGTGNGSISSTSPSKEQLLEQAKRDAGVSTPNNQLLEQAKTDARSETPGTTSKVNQPTTAARSSTSSTTKDAGVKPRAVSVQHSGSSAPTTNYRGPVTIGSGRLGPR